MRSIGLLALPIVLALCAAPGNAADEKFPDDELIREFVKAMPPDATTNAHRVDANGFHLESSQNKELDGSLKPTGNEFQTVIVTAPKTFKIGIEKGRSSSTGGGLAIFNRESGAPILSVGDANGDGQLDGLTYSKVDAAGKVLVSVTDYEADGQADLRVNFAEHYAEIWHIDRWYRVEHRDGRRGILVDGKFIEVKLEKNRFFVP
ncbi:MAG: hypothetical protein ABI616_07185 [Pseudomonadota bacterium]